MSFLSASVQEIPGGILIFRSLSLCVSVCLSVCLSISLSVSVSVLLIFVSCLTLSLFFSLFACSSVSVSLSLCLSISLSLSNSVSVCLSVCLSVSLSLAAASVGLQGQFDHASMFVPADQGFVRWTRDNFLNTTTSAVQPQCSVLGLSCASGYRRPGTGDLIFKTTWGPTVPSPRVSFPVMRSMFIGCSLFLGLWL